MSATSIRTAFFCLLVVLSASVQSANAQIGGDFSLIDHHGNEYRLEQDRGKLVLLFFGYTTCPDICPGTMNHVASVFNQLAEYADQYKGLFITVDPDRDTVQKLASYVPWFGEELQGLTGTREEVDKVAQQYNARYKRLNSSDEDVDYFVDHSTDLYLIGADGLIEAVIPFGLPVEHTVSVLKEKLTALKDTASETVQTPAMVDNSLSPELLEDAIERRSYSGRPLLLNFWASWCEPCRAEIPSLNESYRHHQNLPLEMVAINVGESRQAVKSFLKDYPIQFPVALDSDGISFDRWQLKGLPATLVFDTQGNEVLRVIGERDWSSPEMVQKVHDAVLK